MRCRELPGQLRRLMKIGLHGEKHEHAPSVFRCRSGRGRGACRLQRPGGAVPGPSFQPTAYGNETAGFEFDHPAGWAGGPIEQHSRGGITAFTSWDRPTDVLPGETPAGETRMDGVVHAW